MVHPRILELKTRAHHISYSNVAVNEKGEITRDFQQDLDDRRLNGYLVTWGHKNKYGEKVLRGACAKSIQDRGPNSSSKYKIPMLWQHDSTDPLGLFEELEEDNYGLRFRTYPLDAVPNADRAILQIRSGTINQFSMGFNYVWDKIEYDASDDSIVHKEVDLWEGSVATRGVDGETHALRSDNYVQNLADLTDEMEDFIKTIPRKQQFELRQLITRHTSLLKQEPLELRQQLALDVKEPIIDYAYLKTNLKLFQ